MSFSHTPIVQTISILNALSTQLQELEQCTDLVESSTRMANLISTVLYSGLSHFLTPTLDHSSTWEAVVRTSRDFRRTLDDAGITSANMQGTRRGTISLVISANGRAEIRMIPNAPQLTSGQRSSTQHLKLSF